MPTTKMYCENVYDNLNYGKISWILTSSIRDIKHKKKMEKPMHYKLYKI